MSDIGYIIKTDGGYIEDIEDITNIPLQTVNAVPVRIKDVATVQMTGESRLGIFDLNGEGEAVGGIVVMRYGENAAEVMAGVKEKMKEVAKGLQAGVAFQIVYARSGLCNEYVSSIKSTRN